jgi:16S rRNA (guanine966-N2)-methyltransferase
MKLRIVSGTLRGRYLTIPERDGTFRPTRERVRESVSGILTSRLPGALVADVCAGSGGMGFEMLSRGAAEATFVEPDRFRCKLIREHAQRFGVDGQCRVAAQEVVSFISSCTERFDIIYFDPPYDETWSVAVLPALTGLLAADGVLVYERRSSRGRGTTDASSGAPEPFDRRVYGETEICFYNIS